jgi:hypothetical protein
MNSSTLSPAVTSGRHAICFEQLRAIPSDEGIHVVPGGHVAVSGDSLENSFGRKAAFQTNVRQRGARETDLDIADIEKKPCHENKGEPPYP